MHIQALAIREKEFGNCHPATAAKSYNNVGFALQGIGDLAGAKEMHNQALVIREKELGKYHPDTANSYNNLGFVMYHGRSD